MGVVITWPEMESIAPSRVVDQRVTINNVEHEAKDAYALARGVVSC